MKTIVKKLGISMLALLLVSVGTAMAAGGSTYSSAESINVPDGGLDIFGSYTKGTGDDWFKFGASNGDLVFIDLEKNFVVNYQGEMYLHNEYEGDIEAYVKSTTQDFYGIVSGTPDPRIEINGDWGASYQYVVGINV